MQLILSDSTKPRQISILFMILIHIEFVGEIIGLNNIRRLEENSIQYKYGNCYMIKRMGAVNYVVGNYYLKILV